MRLAGIDIGSNAVRLLVADLRPNTSALDENAEPLIKKVKLFRLPVRLGIDAFTTGNISDILIEKLVKTMQAFVLMMEVYGVENYRACATSALREAQNSRLVMDLVKKETGIDIHLIDGNKEADLILSNKLALKNLTDPRFNHLYVDVGGGSTEISLLTREGLSHSRSFKIGTIRLLKNMVPEAAWDEMKRWLWKTIKPTVPLNIIGSGGNINRIFKRSYNHKGQPLMYDYIKKERDLLDALSIDDRIILQDLNEDRAEVIVNALDIFLFVMEQTDIRQVIVPKIGLADGIVRELFLELTSSAVR